MSTPCKMIVMRDVSDFMRTEQIKAVQKMAELMIATTSHDMRTPLNNIISMHSMIKNRIKNNPSSADP